MTTIPSSTYQIKITLEDAKPPIWRRVLVSDETSLKDLHTTIQIAMGWQNCHLYQFIHEGIFYGELDDDFGMDVKDDSKFKLKKLLKNEKNWLRYEYDFGDGWRHKVVLEKILPYDKKVTLPQCIKAVRACPPEDCGGIWGYEEMLDTLKDKDDPERENLIEWLGKEFDPKESGDLKRINALFKGCC